MQNTDRKNKQTIFYSLLFGLSVMLLVGFTYQGNVLYKNRLQNDNDFKVEIKPREEIDLFSEIPKEMQIELEELKNTFKNADLSNDNTSDSSDWNESFQYADEIVIASFPAIDYSYYRNETFDFTSLEEIFTFFSLSHYREALNDILMLLEKYPKDVNLHFYGGICYFNFGQYEKAIQHFDKSHTIGYTNFREESMWFSALSNHRLENIIRARFFLKKIIKEDKKYASRAKDLLENLKAD